MYSLFPFLESSVMELLFLEHHASYLHSGQTGLSVGKARVATAKANTTSRKRGDVFSVPVSPLTQTCSCPGGAGGVNMQRNREEPAGVYYIDIQQVWEMCPPQNVLIFFYI